MPLPLSPLPLSEEADYQSERAETGSLSGLALPVADRSLLPRQGVGTGSRSILLGRYVQPAASGPEVFYESSEFAQHKDTPWLAAYIKSRHGIDIGSRRKRRHGEVYSIPSSLLARHVLLCGASGSGKTRLALHLLREQLRAGYSAVVLDFKAETIRQALVCAQEAGLSPSQITLLWPGSDEQGVPGWNPFLGDASAVRQAVRQFVAIIEANSTSWGPRLQDVLTNAATVIAGQRLSIFELMRFLQNEDYREGLLGIARQTPAWQEFAEEHDYFANEFAAFPKGERGSVVAPVLNKIRSLVSIKYLRALLCAEDDSLQLSSLWHEQRLLLVHLDAWALGQDGTRLLSGMLAHSLFHTAMHQSGGKPVVLCLDEMGMQERFVGSALKDILAMARSQNLRLMAACQHLDQLSEGLKSALLSNTALRVFFRLGPEDAKRVASSLATGIGNQVSKISIDVARRGKYDPPEIERLYFPLVDMWDRPLSLDPALWEKLERLQASAQYDPDCSRLVEGLQLLMKASGIARVYAKVTSTGETFEVKGFLEGLSAKDVSLEGPSPLRLVVRFPRPKLRVLKEQSEEEQAKSYTKTLMQLPQQLAIARTETGTMGQIKVVEVNFPKDLPDPARYLQNGQCAEEMVETDQKRRQEVEAVAREYRELSAQHLPEARPKRKTVPRTPRESSSWHSYPLIPNLPVEPEVAEDGSL